jgi:hypothetical protein
VIIEAARYHISEGAYLRLPLFVRGGRPAENPRSEAHSEPSRRCAQSIGAPQRVEADILLRRHDLEDAHVARVPFPRSSRLALDPRSCGNADARASSEWKRCIRAEPYALAPFVDPKQLDDDAWRLPARSERAGLGEAGPNPGLDVGDDGRVGHERARANDGEAFLGRAAVERTVSASDQEQREKSSFHLTMKLTILPGT